MAATQQTTTTTGNNSNNIDHNNSVINTINNNNNTNSGTSTPVVGGVTADAATVAVAKDMLQLHHGGPALNSSSNNNNNEHLSENAISSTTAATLPLNNNTNSNNNNNSAPAHLFNAVGSGTNTTLGSPSTTPDNAVGVLRFNQDVLYITDAITVIGRNSSTSMVHFHVAENNLVSRKHFQVLYDTETRDFYVQCLSKNGIFVDDFLQRRSVDPLKLPPSCYFRFPSTEIRIQFESFVSSTGTVHSTAGGGLPLVTLNNNHTANSITGNTNVIIAPPVPDDLHHAHHHQQQQQPHQQQNPQHSQNQPPQNIHHQQIQSQPHPHPLHQTQSSRMPASGISVGPAVAVAPANTHLLPVDNANAIYAPLKISIPKKEQKSPYLSPTGTISAANSCPASPRQGFQQNQTNNYNNYNNSNLQNQDLFQTPSTASYNHNEKPPYSYAQLIVQAISAAPDKQLTLSGIYSFIVKHYPYYRKETNKGWQNSIRHNLSLNRYFIKVARSQDEPGKGSFWRIDPDSGAKLIDHSYKKRRQRSSQGFRPPYGMPRSAPVSPSHMVFADNSRESSPLHEIVLQSAPGSPGISLENRPVEGDIMYNSQNAHQQSVANNTHNQYNTGSPYYVSQQNSNASQQQHAHAADSGNGNNGPGNGVGALIAHKRNHVMASGATNVVQQQNQQQVQQQQQQQQSSLHTDIIYDDMPTDYSGHIDGSGDDDAAACDPAKRPKYVSEVL